MKFFSFVNLGGPINWILFAILCFCICHIIERTIYFINTKEGGRNDFFKRIKEKAESTSSKHETEKTAALLYYEMNRGLWIMNFTGAVSPSIGLLGTIQGLISSFQVIESSLGQTNMQELSGGIWVAMLTTAFGMAISIPMMFFYRFFKRLIEKRMMKISVFIETEFNK